MMRILTRPSSGPILASCKQGRDLHGNFRILVHKPIYASFVEAFQQRVASTSVLGNPFDEATYQGPQVTKQQQERVQAFIDSAVSEGATLMTGGQKELPGDKGYFVRPTVLTDVTDSMTVFRDLARLSLSPALKLREKQSPGRTVQPMGLGLQSLPETSRRPTGSQATSKQVWSG